MRVAVVALGLCMVLAASPIYVARAQNGAGPGGGGGGKGDSPTRTVPLTIGGVVTYNPDGSFGPQVPSIQNGGFAGAFETGSGHYGQPNPPDPPTPSVSDLNGLQD